MRTHAITVLYRDGYYRAPNYIPFGFALRIFLVSAKGARTRNATRHVRPFCSGTLIYYIGAHNMYVCFTRLYDA